MAERKEVKLPAELLSTYVATYALRADVDLVIPLEDGRLMVQPRDQSKVQIYAEAEDRFFMKVAEVQIRFTRDGTGRVTGLSWRQGDREMKAARHQRAGTR